MAEARGASTSPLVKTRKIIQFSLVRFPEAAVAESGHQLCALVISKQITMQRDAALKIKT
jgi:hypothetical protein